MNNGKYQDKELKISIDAARKPFCRMISRKLGLDLIIYAVVTNVSEVTFNISEDRICKKLLSACVYNRNTVEDDEG